MLKWKLGRRPPETPSIRANTADRTKRSESIPEEESITWIGHSSFLLRSAGRRILFDPVLSEYCAPFSLRRFRRKSEAGLTLAAIGPVDAIFITHNHYDHLDRSTVLQLPETACYCVPRGLAGWFQKLGRRNVREFDWGDSAEMLGMRVTSVPAQHFSSRTLWDRDRTLWCGWVLQGSAGTIYVVGDTGYCPIFGEIGAQFGPVDLAVIPIGAYDPRWFMKPMHVNPEEAVQIHLDVRARRSIACHWGTFRLTDEPLDEPPRRLRAALEAAAISTRDFLVLNPGESVVLGARER